MKVGRFTPVLAKKEFPVGLPDADNTGIPVSDHNTGNTAFSQGTSGPKTFSVNA